MWSSAQEADPAEARAWGSGWNCGFYRTKKLPDVTDQCLLRAYYDGKRAGRAAFDSALWFEEQRKDGTPRGGSGLAQRTAPFAHFARQ